MSSDLTSWLLTHYGQEQFHPGLERIKQAIFPLIAKLQTSKIITIAGTNGKGETTLRLSQKLGHRTQCVWTSPHIQRITERFRDENGEISLTKLESLINRCHQVVIDSGFKLSYYEFLFFVFCTWAHEKAPDFLLLEVGLGGRLDAVNVLDADCVLLPSISRDHQEFLGHRYDQILAEKLGTVRSGKILFTGLDRVYLREKTSHSMASRGAKVIHLQELKPLPAYDFSARNELLSHAAFLFLTGSAVEVLNRPETYAQWTPEGQFLEHRGEVWPERGEWTFFGSHNPDGMRKLIQFLHSGNYNFHRPPFDTVFVAFSQRAPVDLKVMLKMLKASELGKVVVTYFDHPKAAPLALIEDLSRQEGLDFVKDIGPQVQGSNNNRFLVTGSYYFLGYFQSRFRS